MRTAVSTPFAQGEHEEASALFTRAAAAAEAAEGLATEGGQGAGGAASSGRMSPVAARELHASSLGGVGRAAVARRDWEGAEDALSKVHADCKLGDYLAWSGVFPQPAGVQQMAVGKGGPGLVPLHAAGGDGGGQG